MMSDFKKVVGILFILVSLVLVGNGSVFALDVNSEEVLKNCMNIVR